MSDLYLYKNQLWLTKYDFRYSGEPNEFTLDPGKYLFICHGAKGGQTGHVNFRNRGGSSYGVIDLKETTTMYAVVGGDGGNSVYSKTEYALGGYNGGGDGGKSSQRNTYDSGAGGGGASDVRMNIIDDISMETYSIPDAFEELDYIENNVFTAILTGIAPVKTTDVELDCIIYDCSEGEFSYEHHYAFGVRNTGDVTNSNCRSLSFPVRVAGDWYFRYWLNNTQDGDIVDHDGIYNERIQVRTNGSSLTVSQNDKERFTMTCSNARSDLNPDLSSDAATSLCVFGNDMGNNSIGDSCKMRLYSFKVYQRGKLSNYFVPCRTKNVEAINIDDIVLENGGINSNGNTDLTKHVRTKGSIKWTAITQPRRIMVCVTDTEGNPLQVDMLNYKKNGSLIFDDYWHDSGHIFYPDRLTDTIRFVFRYPDERDFTSDMIGSVVLKYVDGEMGLCDIIHGTFHPNVLNTTEMSGGYIGGNVVKEKTVTHKGTGVTKSLLSRIIVAGGGGGAQHMSDGSYTQFNGFGGGVNGGYPFGTSSMVNDMKESTQTSGYSFGYGQSGRDRTGGSSAWGMEGLCGGGGGWYGGYAPDTVDCSEAYTAANGGGGSGYIYTDSSYKPEGYLMGYEDREDLKFVDTFMDAGSAEESSVIICEPVDSYNTGDRIICPCVGEGNKFRMFRGEYTVKCYGGFGAHRYYATKAAKGGYAQGTFSNPENQDAFVYVGGSGFFAPTGKSAEFTQSTFPTLCFNGGGNPSSFGDRKSQSGAAGGGTDLRIGTDSLLARIIVAGGGGGTGRNESSGGAGGGAEGGTYTGSGYGTNYGAGKQSSAGSGSDTRISGEFGYGGNGVSQEGGYGGAGGGGWYGGSGTIPDGSGDDDHGGCGGSGYVLTDESYKPSGYMLDERYHMTDTVLTQGGNDLPIGVTKSIIECNNVLNTQIICHDVEGYKSFNESEQKWEYFKSDPLTIEDFKEYGSYDFITDNGLKDNYEIYTFEEQASNNAVRFNVVPPEQRIKTRYYTPYTMTKCIIDADVDTENVNLSVMSKRKGVAEDAHIDFTIICNMKDIPKMETRLYCIQGYTQGTTSGYVELEPKKKTRDHIDLLPVGTGNRMPSRYKSYIGGFIDGTTAITSIRSAVCREYNRCIYSATLCNNTVVRFAKLNLITNTSTVIKDIPKSRLGDTYYGDILIDDKYIYLTSSANDNSRTIWRVSLNPDDITVNSYSPSNGVNFQAVGKMEWYNDHTIIILGRTGLHFFDTNELKWTWKQSDKQNEARRDMVVGKKYLFSLRAGDSSSAYVCDIENNEWFDLTNGFGISWAGKYLNCGCYGDGKFYVTQQNRMHVVDEETMTMVKSIPTPYTNLTPKTAHYANGIVYITIQNSPTLYIYDTKTDRFTSAGMPFYIDNWYFDGWIRGCSFRGYFFVPHIRMYTINYVEYAKYNMGYKYDQFVMVTNNESEERQGYEYDERFVTFTDANMWIHTGDIVVDLESLDEEGKFRKCSMTKDQYNKLIKVDFIKST